MILNASNVKGISGIWNSGKLPAIDARSPTRGTAILKNTTNPVTIPIATNGGGIALETFEVNHIMNIVPKTNARVKRSLNKIIISS